MLLSYRSRAISIFFAFFFAYVIIMVNLFFTQIVNQQFYQELKNKQYYVTITTTPARAPIYDRHGNPLALNRDSVAAFIMPKHLTSPNETIAFLEQYFPTIRQRYEQHKNNHFMYIQRRLTQEQQNILEQAGLQDIHFLQEPSRYYPIPSMGPLLGITDIDNKGLFGIELQFNDLLAGKPTTVTLARDARTKHFYFNKETKITGKEGNALTLTIDGTLQYILYDELKKYKDSIHAQEAALIVIDPNSGDILSMVHLPDFDPNRPDSIDLAYAKNNIITDTHELGSVIKVFSALACLQEGVVQPDEIIDCKNTKTTYIDGRKINTVYPGGLITFSEVIEKSNNIGIAIAAKRLGSTLYDHYIKIGFGKKTGIPFPGEQKGFVNPPQHWSKQSLISLSYGYEIRCSLLQLARAFCIIARDGKDVVLKLTQDDSTQQEPCCEQLYNPEAIGVLKNILEQACRKRRWRKSPLDAYRIMSKTGTANMLIDGQYDKDRNLFTCAGIIEAPNTTTYQRVIVVFIKEIPQKNVYAATIAAPLFDVIAEKVVIHDKVV